MPDALDAYIASRRDPFEKTLSEWVAIQTVSASPEHRSHILRGAEAGADELRSAGADASVVPTGGNPVVFGRFDAGARHPTVTVYNHLDVQPADEPQWRSDPFVLHRVGDVYYGRGATDDKGPALTALAAAQFVFERGDPLNIHFVWELEEEIGSPHFDAFVRDNRAMLGADSIVVSDTIWISRRRPAIPFGLRGLVTVRVRLSTGVKDVHSGLAGGGARNPLTELAALVAECCDPVSGRVRIPGFYDDVRDLSEAEIREFMASGFEVAEFRRAHGLEKLRTEDPLGLMRRIWTEPTFEVHGLAGGYQGPGVKTAIPPSAELKVSMRLVPAQSPAREFDRLRSFVLDRLPDATVEMEGALAPFDGPREGPYRDAAYDAMRHAFGIEPAGVREGGSIGAVVSMSERLEAPVLFLGLSLPEHGYHAPNEHFDWAQASGGMRMFVRYFENLARIPARSAAG